ncbi:MAG: tetratricopeptide repeat protein, partial [Desulfobacterales bacterium]|nr:tetratricopeptide repeat protein [Desulfobacterales bacterium]
KIYKLVTEKYPGTEGYVDSTVKIAQYTDDLTEKERLYRLVIDEFPDNPLVRISMLGLADLQKQRAEYDNSISTIKEILARDPKGLNADALDLLQNVFDIYLKKLLEKNDYAKLLTIYEAEKTLIDPFESSSLFFSVGDAYLRGHLYEKAFELLMKSYKLFAKGQRPPELISALGIAMQESGRADDALSMFSNYIRLFPNGRDIVEVYHRQGNIYQLKNDDDKALKTLSIAYNMSTKEEKKANVLIDEAAIYRKQSNPIQVTVVLNKAIEHLNKSQKPDAKNLAFVYKQLGENYHAMKAYGKAVDALSRSIELSGVTPTNVDVRFMLAESYEKGKELDKAEKLYNDVIASGDAFWAKLAEERLQGLKLETKLQKT